MKYSKGSTSISITLRREVLDRLNSLAERSRVPRNRLVVMALERFLASNAARIMAHAQEAQEGEKG